MTRPQDKTVLVVDDEPNVRQYLAQILLDAGFNVVQAGDGIVAMEIIQELEPTQRGIYAGAIGYLDYSGNLDTCIAIRTVVLQDGRAYLQAGAGIVADSVPEFEDKECYSKAEALFRALELGEELSGTADS